MASQNENNVKRHFDPQEIRILDGAMATELEKRGFDLSGPLWSAHVIDSQPSAIVDVHLDYLRAGCDVISTSSYQISQIGYEKLGRSSTEADWALRKSISLASEARVTYRKESNRNTFIAASLGPYGAALHNGAEYHGFYDVTFEYLVDFHLKRLLVVTSEPKVDVVALETVPSLEEVNAIIEALNRLSTSSQPSSTRTISTHNGLMPPVWVSLVCKDNEHVCHGEKLSECFSSLVSCPHIVAIGINCTHPRFILPLLKNLSLETKPIFVYPNSGEEWDANARQWTGKSDIDSFVDLAQTWYAAGAQAVGGCCRTGPKHIEALRALNHG